MLDLRLISYYHLKDIFLWIKQSGKRMTGDRKKINRIILAVIFVAYVVFNGLLLIRHEQWRDEANVWLMAGELSPM